MMKSFSIEFSRSFVQIILKTNSSPTSAATPGQILQTADGQLIILQSAEQHQQAATTQYVQVGGQSMSKRFSFIHSFNEIFFF